VWSVECGVWSMECGCLTCLGIRDIADISRSQIKGSRGVGRFVDGHSCRARDDKVPFVRGGMPVDFPIFTLAIMCRRGIAGRKRRDLPHSARLDRNERGREVACDGETGTINNLHTAPRHFKRLLLRKVVAIAHFVRDVASRTGSILRRQVCGSWRPREYVEFPGGQIVKSGGVGAKVLSKDRLWDALEELGDQRGTGVGEGAFIEDEQELDSVVEGLDAVGNASGEAMKSLDTIPDTFGRCEYSQPDIASLKVILEDLPSFIRSRETDGTV
jgi:hypothetical protein